MLLAIVFLNLWGVLQLVALGSLARTVRARTVLAGVAVGLFFCAPFAALLEYAWASALAALTDRPLEAVIAVTGYTTDPPFEEIVRILPLAFLLIVPVIRRQLSVTDCVLIGAAAGAGFGLAEDLYRFGTSPQHATAVPGGWVAPHHSPVVAFASQMVFIPSITTALGGWLPDLGGAGPFGLSHYMQPNLLLIWSSLAGLAVGLWLRLEGPRRWFIAGALLAYASAAHAANNADLTFGRQLLVTAPFRALSNLQLLMPLAALAVAWWIDRRLQGDVPPEHLLAAERGVSPRALGTLRASVARMPDSIVWVERFVRVRRAYNTERRLGGPDAEQLGLAIGDVRGDIDRLLQQPGSWRATGVAWVDNARRVLRQRTTVVWIVLALPSVLWFVVGGWPATAGIQPLLSAGVGWSLAVALTVAAQAWMGWRTITSLPSQRRLLMRIPICDPGAGMVLGIVGAAGALGFGAFGLLRMSATMTAALAHALDALASLASQLLPLANLGAALAEWLRRLGEMRIPVPFTHDKYVTPEGPWKDALNTAGREFVHSSGPLGRGLEIFDGEAIPQFDTTTSDPNNWNPYVAPVTTFLAWEIFLGATAGPAFAPETARGPKGTPPRIDPALEATQPRPPFQSPLATTHGPAGPKPSPVKPPVDPFAVTQPSPGLGAPVPMSVLQREAAEMNRLGSTQPAPSPMAKSVGAPAAHPGLGDTVPAPARRPAPEGTDYLKPGDTLKIDDP